MARVETRAIKKYFGEVRAVDGVDLAPKDGEFIALLGPSGCGKTTLLRIIAGLETPTFGEVLIGERVVNDLPPRARGVAMVFQTYGLYPHMSVFDNIAFPLKTQGVRRELVRGKVQWAARMLGIETLFQRKPRELSGGERQRVALGRALVREPSVLLLDEPLSNLDAKLRASAREELKHFQRRVGTTTIYVTHDQVEAMGLGDRIAVMEQGKVRQVGTPEEVYDQPADTFVATFLGTPPMNLVERAGEILGFRPENFLPTEFHDVQDNLVEFCLRLTRAEYLGSERILYGVLEGRGSDVRVAAKLPSNFTKPFQEGNRYLFAVRAKDVSCFDKGSGRRISHP